jgi:hypothetical protein
MRSSGGLGSAEPLERPLRELWRQQRWRRGTLNIPGKELVVGKDVREDVAEVLCELDLAKRVENKIKLHETTVHYKDFKRCANVLRIMFGLNEERAR